MVRNAVYGRESYLKTGKVSDIGNRVDLINKVPGNLWH